MDVFRLIDSHDVDGVRAWIKNEKNKQNFYCFKQRTPLMFALSQFKQDIAKLFVENELYIFDENENGITPLHRSAKNGFTEITLLLIGKGANVNAANKCGQLPIHFAAVNGKVDVVQILIENGSEVNTLDKWNRNPLGYSILWGGAFGGLKMLLDEGAALFNNGHYLKKSHQRNKKLLEYHFKLQAFILVRKENNSILDRSSILRFSKTFKLSFKE